MIEWKTVLRVFVAALLFRVIICLIFANEIIPGSDQMQEIALGGRLASGDLYGVLDTYWAPLYPILIGIASLFTDSIIIPAALVSIVAGSLVVALTYVLVRQSYGQREALIAAPISIFFPHLINAVVALGSENVFVALLLGVLILTWRVLLSGSTALCLIVGALLGLAYLSRPEAIGFSLYVVLTIIAVNYRRKRRFVPQTLRQIAALLLGLFLFATPYLLYLRAETGSWTISGKAKINTIVGGFDADQSSLEDYSRNGPVKEFGRYFLANLVEVQKVLPVLLPLFLWVFIGLGLFADPWETERSEREVFLLLFCLVTIAGYAAAVVQLRYFYVLLPVLIGWVARGIVRFANWWEETVPGQGSRAPAFLGSGAVTVAILCAIFLYVLPLNFYTQGSDRLWATSGYEERDAGLWLRKNSAAEPYVFSASRRPVFFARARQLPPKTENPDEILAEIKRENVDYVVTSERSLKRNPYLTGFDRTLRNDPDFEVVYDQTPRKGYGIVIFKRTEGSVLRNNP